jgi:sugar phosphate isomerase/epimerase
MPTLLELKSPEACAALCSELGLDFVELSMDLPEYQTNKLDIKELRRIADRYGIYYTMHLSGFLNPCDFNDKIAAAYVETALEAIQAAKQLGAPVLNMHLPTGDFISPCPTEKSACLTYTKQTICVSWRRSGKPALPRSAMQI